MRRFRLCEHSRTEVRGTVHVQAWLQVWREGDWALVGVFGLREDEWMALVELCQEHGMQVTRDVKAVPA